MIKCFNKSCNGGKHDLKYVQRTYEYFDLKTMPDNEGNFELGEFHDSHVDDDYTSYITCEICNKDFYLNGEEKT